MLEKIINEGDNNFYGNQFLIDEKEEKSSLIVKEKVKKKRKKIKIISRKIKKQIKMKVLMKIKRMAKKIIIN